MGNGVFLLLGTNLGDRMANLSIAWDYLQQSAGAMVKQSSVYKTAAWGKTDQPDFYNQAVMLDTALSPHELLDTALRIENIMGRKREEKWASRIIDIDILFYGEMVVTTPQLAIPHPGIAHRRFVLQPMAEIAGEFIHPELRKTIATLLKECSDHSAVELIDNKNLK
jgi:2-amino-4-hydroxy-6-hydroxymethyldihydropteridine diphosphokinase